ncbi:MAG: hypothetical protein FD138_395 [Planctomycetota bacterium]|nr:MAG: hypothetical protein FD138_395 [Planctomycetota bacterium]
MLPHQEAGKLQPTPAMCRSCLGCAAAGVLEVSVSGFNNAAALVNTLELRPIAARW